MKTTLLTCTILALMGSLMARPNAYEQPTPGNQFTIYKTEVDSATFHPGNGGTGQSWILDTLPTESFTVSIEEAYKNPFASHFSSADIVVENDVLGNYPPDFGDEHYHFYSIANGNLTKLGHVYYDSNTGESEINKFTNSEIKMKEPFLYGFSTNDSWEGSYEEAFTGKTIYWSDARTSYEFDAIGHMRVDGIKLNNVYRLKRERTFVERAPSQSSITRKVTTYEWWKEDLPYPILILEHVHAAGNEGNKYFAYYLDKSHYLYTGLQAEKNRNGEVKLYPNPAKDHVIIDLGDDTGFDGSLSLIDASGRVVQTWNANLIASGVNRLNLDVKPGLYMLRTERQGEVNLQKLLVN